MQLSPPAAQERPVAHWGAVFALSLCVSTLIASEFMPVSLLTPIAAGLHVTEGRAGQAIAVSGISAVITSLVISRLTQGLNRRLLLLILTSAMLASGLIVALAPNFWAFMFGRALIGVAIGGFWSMSTAVLMQLVPARDLPKGLALLNGGNALSTTIAAPLGSFLGQFVGWRGAFFMVVPLALIVLVWQFFSLPSIPPAPATKGNGTLGLLRRREASIGIGAATLMFMGQFWLFTYLRPFLENITHVDTTHLSLMLLLMGGSGLVGTALISRFIAVSLRGVLFWTPAVMALLALALILFGAYALPTAVFLIFWGMLGTAAPVAWWTWLSRTLPNDVEAGGGLMVAAIQLAITIGAALGGVLYDALGGRATFGASAVILAAGAILALVAPIGVLLITNTGQAAGEDADVDASPIEASA